jgi:ribosomal protein S18 acetylase RimI-like enzyme
MGSALLRAAETSAASVGATALHLDSSLAAIEFYQANGFAETGRGEHHLRAGGTMACVFMQKKLGGVGVQ